MTEKMNEMMYKIGWFLMVSVGAVAFMYTLKFIIDVTNISDWFVL